MIIHGMPEQSLVKRILAVLAKETKDGTLTVPIHKLRKLAPNDCLTFSLNDEETQLTVSLQSGMVQMTPLLPLEPEPEQKPRATVEATKVVRRSPEEEADLIQRKLREQQIEEAIRTQGPMQASLGVF